jgi:hypothetical protein
MISNVQSSVESAKRLLRAAISASWLAACASDASARLWFAATISVILALLWRFLALLAVVFSAKLPAVRTCNAVSACTARAESMGRNSTLEASTVAGYS